MIDQKYDLVVIGGGSAGLIAAGFSAQLGQRVAIVEKSRIGGDCTWTGCVPSKTLLKVAKVAHEMRTAHRYVLDAVEPVVDLKSVMVHVRSAVEEVYLGESPEKLRAEGVDVVLGEARFLDPKTLAVTDQQETLKARRFIIATGAKPLVPPIPGLDSTDYLTYETVWDLDELPKRLIIVGAGPIGCELAQAFRRLGSSVTLLEAAPRILLHDEPEAADLLSQHLVGEGVDLRVNAAVQRVWQGSDGIHLDLGSDEVMGDDLLISVGRTPNVSGLNLDNVGVEYDSKGIKVNGASAQPRSTYMPPETAPVAISSLTTPHGRVLWLCATPSGLAQRGRSWNKFPGPHSPTRKWPTWASPRSRLGKGSGTGSWSATGQ